MYMSYCRFEGTKQELRRCFNDVEEHINEEAEYKVSEDEIRHFRSMVADMIDFLQETEIMDEYGELDRDALDSVCEAMRRGYED